MARNAAHSLLLFGATGDLAQRMLLPSLFGLDAEGLLPDDLKVVATARSAFATPAFREAAGAAIERHVDAERRRPDQVARFLDCFVYVSLDASDPAQFGRLAAAVGPTDGGLANFPSTAMEAAL